MKKNRVVVTGMGCVSPLGNSVQESWESAIHGRSGIGVMTRVNPELCPVKTAAEVKQFQISDYIHIKEGRRMDRYAQFAVASALMAVEDSQLHIGTDVSPERVGVWMGTAIGGLESFEEQHQRFLKFGYEKIYPFAIPLIIPNMASCQVSIYTGAKGINSCTVMSCVSGSNSIGESFKAIQRGDADVMIAGGAEAPITEMGIASFAAMGVISKEENPAVASRPFDQKRSGFVMGEGAGILVLESLESALKRKARIYGEVVGYGTVGDAHHITSPHSDGDGIARAIHIALNDADLCSEQIEYISAHGTSTIVNDRCETMGMKKAFGNHAYHLSLSSTKSMTGHMMGATGAIESIFSLLTLHHDVLPPTINYEHPDEECDLDYVPNVARHQRVEYVMNNAMGFGGHNTSLIFKKHEGN